MMEDHEFCDNCSGCRPSLIDTKTKQRMADDNPIMIKINQIWDNETTYAQRRAFIKVTLHNSRNLVDLRRMQEVVQMFESISI